MQRSEHHNPTAAPARAGAREGGFGLIEMIIVLVVIAILAAVAMLSFTGAKSTAAHKEAVAAGTAYDQAIAKFLADNANNPPGAAHMVTVSGKPAGPVNLLGKPHIGTLPDGVVGDRIGVSMDGANCTPVSSPSPPSGAPATASAWISYCAEPAPGYGIRVMSRRNGGSPWTEAEGAKVCWLGNTANQPAC